MEIDAELKGVMNHFRHLLCQERILHTEQAGTSFRAKDPRTKVAGNGRLSSGMLSLHSSESNVPRDERMTR